MTDKVAELETRLTKLEALDSLQTDVMLDLWALAMRVQRDGSFDDYDRYLRGIEESMRKVVELRTGKPIGDGDG